MILWLIIWNLIDTEPFIGGSQKPRQMTFNVFYIINSWCQWIVDVNDDNLPISLFFIKQRHNTEDFDLLDLTRGRDKLANFTDIERIIVSSGFGFGVNDVGVFPGLNSISADE